MNKLIFNLASATKSPHVSIPMAMVLLCEVGKIWLPAYAQQFDATQKLFIAYGVISAANTSPTVPPVSKP